MSKTVNYILKTTGITLPDYKRSDLVVGKCVQLEESVGDKFAARGFVVKASEAASKDDNALNTLKEKNAKLVKANEALSKEIEALKKAK